MNLTPEQREIGKQNFDEAVGTTRRDFLKGTVAAAVGGGAGLGAMYFGYGAEVSSSRCASASSARATKAAC